MSDWHNIELEAVAMHAERADRIARELAPVINGRCEHGFVAGLCPNRGCPGAVADPEAKKLCRLCGKKGRLSRERTCATCTKAIRRKTWDMEAAE